MPFTPDDDRFYDSLNKSGDQYRGDRMRVAEEQAAHAREMGNIYGQALPNTLNAGLKGADWRQNRELGNQTYQNRASQEGRAEEDQGFKRSQEGRQQKTFDTQLPMFQDQAASSRIALDRARREQGYEDAPVGAEEAAQVGYTGTEPLSHYQLSKRRGEEGEKLGLDTGRQNLANAKQQANAVAQQIAQNATTFKNNQYTFQAQTAQTDLANAYAIEDPKLQEAALQHWREHYASTLLSPETLTNMAAAGAATRRANLATAEQNQTASTKLIYGRAMDDADAMTQKLAAAQKLSQNAKIYDKNVNAVGYQNPNADSARENAARILESPMFNKAAVADQVRNGFAAHKRGILTEQAQKQADETYTEFKEWYDRQPGKVQQLAEVKRAYQQAEALKSETGQSGDKAELSKVKSLVGGGNGANTSANGSFLTGGTTGGGAQGYGQPQGVSNPAIPAGYFTQPARPAPPRQPAPAPAPQQQFSPDQVQGGQHMAPDPYGLIKGGKPKGGAYGSR